MSDEQNRSGASSPGDTAFLEKCSEFLGDCAGKWWNPNARPPEIEHHLPDPLTVFGKEDWIAELKEIVENEDKDAGFRDNAEIFLGVYNEEVVPKCLEKEGLEELVMDMEKKYARVAAYFECIDKDEEDKRIYSEVVQAVNDARNHQAKWDQSDNGSNSQADSEVMINIASVRNERSFNSTYKALREYAEKPDNLKWQEEKQAIAAGTEVKRATIFKWYLIDHIHDEDISEDREKKFAEILEYMGEDVIADLIKAWSKKYDCDTGTALTDTIDKALRRLLCRFPKKIIRGGQDQQSPMSRQDLHAGAGFSGAGDQTRREQTPPVRQQQLYMPTSSQPGTTDQPRHTSSVSLTAGNRFYDKNRSHIGPRTHPSVADLTTSQQNPVNLSESVQQPLSTEAVLQQTVSVMKDMQQKNLESNLLLAEKLNRQQSSGSGVKLANIELWEYEGNPLNFQDWWIRFKSVYHDSDRLTENSKLIYLSQYISKKAQNKCWGQGIDTLTYKEALKKVKDTFNDKQKLFGLCLDKITQQAMPRDDNDIKGIRSLVNTTREMINKLDGLEYPQIAYSSTTMVHFMEKINLKLQVKMMDKLNYERFDKVPLKELIDGLDRYCRIHEHTTIYLEHKTKIQGNVEPPRQITTLTGVIQQKYNEKNGYGKCIFCNHRGGFNGHKWKNCSEVKDPEKRWEKFRELNLCLACGSNKHYFKDCISPRVCGEANKACTERHHQSLHDYYASKFYRSRRTPQGSRSNSPRRVQFEEVARNDQNNTREGGSSQQEGNARAGR